MKKTDLAYLAGTIDSDGCISIAKYSNCRAYRLAITVVQRDMPLIEYLYNTFDGSVNIVSTKRKDSRDFYLRWMITDHRAFTILCDIRPYLRLKVKQTDLAIALYEEKYREGNKAGKNFRYSNESIDIQKNLFFDIKKLNSPATTECVNSLKKSKEMRQSELAEMKNRQRENRSILSA